MRRGCRRMLGAGLMALLWPCVGVGEMVPIPAGIVLRGDPQGLSGDALPVHRIQLSGFWIGRNEVTLGEVCGVFNWAIEKGLVTVRDGKVFPMQGPPRALLNLEFDFNRLVYTPPKLCVNGRRDLPCILISWHGALAYCAYRTAMENERGANFTQAINLDDGTCDFSATGYRLPTEAEWERAARGDRDGHHYPWPSEGDAYENFIDPMWANYVNEQYPAGRGPLPVGSFRPPGGIPYGFRLNDMAGNVWEWCWDFYDAKTYQAFPVDRWPTDPVGPRLSPWDAHVIRGGAWFSVGSHLRCGHRSYMHHDDMTPYTGFRVARSTGPRRIAETDPPAWPSGRDAQIEAEWREQDGLTTGRIGWADAASNAVSRLEQTLNLFPDDSQRAHAFRLRAVLTSPDSKNWQRIYLEARWLRRAIVLAQPELNFDRLLCIAGGPGSFLSNVSDQYLGRWSRAGPGLAVLENWKSQPVLRLLTKDLLPAGAIQGLDLSYDGDCVAFSYCDHTPPREERVFRLHEIRIDGTGLRALTASPQDASAADFRGPVMEEDFDPCYLPDGGVAFMSTRCQAFGRCHGGRYVPTYLLYRCDRNGTNREQLSAADGNEWTPAVLPDGSLIFTHWDYINRNSTVYMGLWTCRPDGTGFATYYGNATYAPCMVTQAQPVPGSAKVVAIASAQHSISCGSVLLIDRRQGVDGALPLTRLTPEIAFPETEGWPTGNYAYPRPLSEKLFLVAYAPDRVPCNWEIPRFNAYGLYVLDATGGRELIFRSSEASFFAPIPVVPRARPPVLPNLTTQGASATLVLQHALRGVVGMDTNAVRALRVVQVYPQPYARSGARSVVEIELPRRVVGMVPLLARDGSAVFNVPADVPLLFQLVDEKGQMRMGMRSQVYVRPGEVRTCTGCHESRQSTPPMASLALRRNPAPMLPSAGPQYSGGFSFSRTVQPVLDRYCIRCHGLERREGALSLLGSMTKHFSEAYDHLVSRSDWVVFAQRRYETGVSEPNDYGARASRLPHILTGSHHDRVTLDDASARRLWEWMDINAPFYGNYDVRRPEQDPPNEADEQRLRQEVRKSCGGCHASMADQPLAALVNRTQPQESRVLMAPFSLSAGGWGLCRGTQWRSRQDQAFVWMEKRVLPLSTGSSMSSDRITLSGERRVR